MLEQVLYSDISYSLAAFLSNPVKLQATIASFSIAILSLYLLQRKNTSQNAKTALIYAHIASFFFPFVLFAYSTGCSTALASCAGSGCAALANVLCAPNLINLIVYPIPITLVLAMLVGFVVLPFMHSASTKSFELGDKALKAFTQKWSKRLEIREPRLYAVDSPKPFAFSYKSFKPAVFLSVGLMELLGRKEKEAVVLHELYHVKSRDSKFKFSTQVMKFSPFSIFKNFSQELSEEERKADEFAASAQRTSRHVNSAKRKINEFNDALAR